MAESSGKLKDANVCRIFFSSPFNGMEGEREELTKRYWPQIQSLCSSKGVQFVPVDMRWGITTQHSSDYQTVNICLREIDRSDLFIGFFGQRYGWQGEKDEVLQQNFDVALPRYPWLQDHRKKSVTELEFLHGHLNDPGKIPACILFRDKAFDDARRKEAEEKGDKRGIYKFSPETDLAVTLMDELKLRVEDVREKALDVHLSYATPELGAELMFNVIWKHLNEVLLKDVQPSEGLSWVEREDQQQDMFCSVQTGFYSGGDEMMGRLNSYVTATESEQTLVVTGPPGSGKTALLCNWIHRLRDVLDSDTLLFYHFTACSSTSSTILTILKRVVSNLLTNMAKIPKWESINEGVKVDGMTDHQLINKWADLLVDLSSEGHKVIMIIDGINSVRQKSKAYKPLYWLPEKLHRNIHLIVSTQSNDEENLEEFQQNRNCMTLEVSVLDPQDIHSLSKDILLVRGKELAPEQLSRVVAAPSSRNPLFLRVVLEELCVFGKFRELDKKIDSLVTCESSNELFAQVIERLERDYNSTEISANIVEKVLCALVVSRHGLTEEELCSLINIPSHLWAPLYYSVHSYLLSRDGFLSLAREEFKEAVVKKYLNEDSAKDAVTKEQMKFFVEKYKSLVDRNAPVPRYYFTEMPWLAQQAQDHQSLLDMICNVNCFEQLLLEDEYGTMEHIQWLDLTQEQFVLKWDAVIDRFVADEYIRSFEKFLKPDPVERTINVLSNLTIFLSSARMYLALEHFLLRMQRILEGSKSLNEGSWFDLYHICLYRLACMYCETHDYKDSAALHQQIIDAYSTKDKDDSTHITRLASASHGLGTALIGLGKFEEAEEMFLKSIDAHRKNSDKSGLEDAEASSLSMIAESYSKRGEYKTAVEYALRCLEIEDRLAQGQLTIKTSYTCTNLGIYYRQLKNYAEAEKVYARAMKIKERILGWYHEDVAIGCVNMSNLMRDREDYVTAVEWAKKGLDIFKKIGHWDNVVARNSKENLLLLYVMLYTQGQNCLDDGIDLYWDVVDSLVERHELHLGIPFVHDSYMRYLFNQKKYDDVIRIATTFLSCEQMRSSLMFCFLHHIDLNVNSDAFVQRTDEHSLHTGLGYYPGDRWLVNLKITHSLVPSRDLEGILEVMEKYLASFEDAENTDRCKSLVLEVQEICEGVEWKEGALGLLEHYKEGKLANCEDILRNLAVIYHGLKEWQKSLECFKAAALLNPDVWLLQEKAAFLHLMLGEVEEGRKIADAMETKWSSDENVMAKVKQIREIAEQAGNAGEK